MVVSISLTLMVFTLLVLVVVVFSEEHAMGYCVCQNWIWRYYEENVREDTYPGEAKEGQANSDQVDTE